MDEDWGCAGDHVVGVGAVDGQVVGDLGCGVAMCLLDGGGGAVGLLELVARLDVGRVYEGRLRDVVEGVGRGGGEGGRKPAARMARRERQVAMAMVATGPQITL
nr:hypothetical protein [Actinomadura bangladeshensis]